MEFSKKNIRSAPSQKQAENAIEEEKGEGLRSHATMQAQTEAIPATRKETPSFSSSCPFQAKRI
jgi:hypothetical protein